MLINRFLAQPVHQNSFLSIQVILVSELQLQSIFFFFCAQKNEGTGCPKSARELIFGRCTKQLSSLGET